MLKNYCDTRELPGSARVAHQESTPTGCSKRPSSKAAGESKPEAYPLGYVEDFDEPRTPLAGVFSILLLEHWLLLFKPLHLTLQFLHSIL